jgi:hypothetical protein
MQWRHAGLFGARVRRRSEEEEWGEGVRSSSEEEEWGGGGVGVGGEEEECEVVEFEVVDVHHLIYN